MKRLPRWVLVVSGCPAAAGGAHGFMVATFAGSGAPGPIPGGVQPLDAPAALALGPAGILYVADARNQDVRTIDPSGGIRWLAGGAAGAGYADGPPGAARFLLPEGIAVSGAGLVYVADTHNNRIRTVDASGDVATLAGDGTAGWRDGPGATAEFFAPHGLALDAIGNLYVADTLDHRIRKLDASGNVSTVAGSGVAGFADGPGAAAQFSAPEGVAVDAAGNVYVADTGNDRIREIDPGGTVTTLAGNGAAAGCADGPGVSAELYRPASVAVDATGQLFFADTGNHRICRLDPSGSVETLAGNCAAGDSDGQGGAAQLAFPRGLAVDATGHVYVADTGNNRIRKLSP